MVFQNETEKIIKEVQSFLYLLSGDDDTIPRVSINGEYDEITTAAVRSFQALRGLEENGKVDYLTYSKLVSEKKRVETEKLITMPLVGGGSFPLSEGDNSESVRMLNLMINELSVSYDSVPYVGTGTYYGKNTANAVLTLTEIFNTPITESVDKHLYYRILKELRAITTSKNNFPI